jgi:hypothetical protein
MTRSPDTAKVESVDEPRVGTLPDALRAWVDLVEMAGQGRPVAGAPDAEPISPELVLVDPVLRSRLGELPTGPDIPPLVRIVYAEAPSTAAPSYGPGLVASVAYVCALVLALPVLAIAADFVRSGGPHLAPPVVAPTSGQVHIPLQQHVVTKRPRNQSVQRNRSR